VPASSKNATPNPSQATNLEIFPNKALLEQPWFAQEKAFKAQLQHALIKDRFELSKQRRWLLQQGTSFQQDENSAQAQDKLEAKQQAWLGQFISSCEALTARVKASEKLKLNYPEQLPVSAKRDAIQALIAEHQVVIVAGETGSGKTTQLPKMCLELGLGRFGVIGHTQPRRVAAQAVSRRLSEELNCTLGQEVGYQVRFNDHSQADTLVKVMTDGVLLAEIAHDRFLEKYDCLIIDEAHERSLNIDFLLGYLKQILAKRSDLKVIITSATIDTERFSKHFNQAPVVSVEGRSFPVEMVYMPLEELSAEKSLSQALEQVLMLIEEDERELGLADKGDVLVFLPGEGEIRQISTDLRHSHLKHLEVLPLYARLSGPEQQKILSPNPNNAIRRVVLATNVAETSLTVPGIRYVVDSGLARVSRYSHRSKVQQLPVEKISKAAANQRAGRCGRVAEGVCFRLFSEEDFQLRDDFTQPEIQRTNLSSVILQMQILRMGDVAKFPFLDAPDKRLINDGFKQLFELGALNPQRKLTELGRQIARLPIDPQLARIVLQAAKESSLTEILIIVSALAIQDPREYPQEKREAAQQKHSVYKDKDSDFIGLLNLWNTCEQARQEQSKSAFKRWAQKNFLAGQRLHEWRELHRQLLGLIRPMKLKLNSEAADWTAIHRALLTGFITQVGFQSEPRLFSGARNRSFRIFPNSYIGRKAPKWIMAAQLIETSQLFAHKVGKIEPQWIEELAPHLLKHHYAEPYFSSKRNEVMAWKTSTLYGLLVSERSRVSYAQIDPELSHELFVREALVNEQLNSNAPFYVHNKQLRAEAELLEEKTRRRDIVVNDEVVFAFYRERLPKTIVNGQGLEKWRKREEKQQPKTLFAPKSLFIKAEAAGFDGEQFPDHIEWQGVKYPLKYSFNPGQEGDGLTIFVPIESLNRVPKYLFEWLVPGLLPEKVEALLKCLPKQHRRQIVPIPDTVQAVLPKLRCQDVPLTQAIAKVLAELKGLKLKHEDWQFERLSDYYRATIALIDNAGSLSKTEKHKANTVLETHEIDTQRAGAKPALPIETKAKSAKVSKPKTKSNTTSKQASADAPLDIAQRIASTAKLGGLGAQLALASQKANQDKRQQASKKLESQTPQKVKVSEEDTQKLKQASASAKSLAKLSEKVAEQLSEQKHGQRLSQRKNQNKEQKNTERKVEQPSPIKPLVKSVEGLSKQDEKQLQAVLKPKGKRAKTELIDQSKDLNHLIQKHGAKVQQRLAKQVGQKQQQRLYTQWDFDDLAQEVAISSGASELIAYPALQDSGTGVKVVLCDYPHVQRETHLRGLCRLALLSLASSVKYIRKEVLKGNQFTLSVPKDIDISKLKEDLLFAAIKHSFFAEHQPMTKAGFDALIQQHRQALTNTALKIDKMLHQLFKYDHQLRQGLMELQAKQYALSLEDIQQQREQLIYNGFIYAVEAQFLYELPRYLEALHWRLDRIKGNLNKDIELSQMLQRYQQQMLDLIAEDADVAQLASLKTYRWMLEEYRVSLFAQQLKTLMPISAKRLDKQWRVVLDEKNGSI